MRHSYSVRRDEVAGRCKIGQAYIRVEVVSKVSSIRQVEYLKNCLQIRSLFDLKVLRYACV